MNAALHLEDPGLWKQVLADVRQTAGKPALFLDRDGTINVDTGFPRRPADIVLREEIVPVINAANDAGLPAVIVSNQSGIARGMFGWKDFAAVNARLVEALEERGCLIAAVLACAYHEDGKPPLGVADHPMRKPNPGMLLRAAELLKLDLARSIIVGDKTSDMEAGRRAGLSAGWLVGGEGRWNDAQFVCEPLSSQKDHAALRGAIMRLGQM